MYLAGLMMYCKYVSLEWRSDSIILAVVRGKKRLKVNNSVIGSFCRRRRCIAASQVGDDSGFNKVCSNKMTSLSIDFNGKSNR